MATATPSSGTQDVNTTEDSVYANSDGASETRAGDARFFVPTEHEWYRAAYYHRSNPGCDGDGFCLYPTYSNTKPTTAMANAAGDISNPGPNVVNYSTAADRPGHVTTVGSAGAQSEHAVGASDQGLPFSGSR